MDLYANWMEVPANKYIVTFIAGGGIPAMSHQFIEQTNGKATVPIPFPAKENYYLEGWYESDDYT